MAVDGRSRLLQRYRSGTGKINRRALSARIHGAGAHGKVVVTGEYQAHRPTVLTHSLGRQAVRLAGAYVPVIRVKGRGPVGLIVHRRGPEAPRYVRERQGGSFIPELSLRFWGLEWCSRKPNAEPNETPLGFTRAREMASRVSLSGAAAAVAPPHRSDVPVTDAVTVAAAVVAE